MKEINIGNILSKLRKDKHITQEQLAQYIGVSKTAVSKWETGQSYPDVTFLPMLASYFDISIDHLMGYQPQMSEEDIAVVYKRLCKDFLDQEFEVVVDACRSLVKKYYSCYKLVSKIAILYVNHAMLANNEITTRQLYEEARDLCRYVKGASDIVEDIHTAITIEVYCDLVLHEPKEAIQVLGAIKSLETNYLLANAYYMDQNIKEAELTLQVDIFQSFLNIFQSFALLLTLHMQDLEKFDDDVDKIFSINELLSMHKMNPGVILPLYIVAMQGYLRLGEKEKALALLEKYVQLVTKEITTYEIVGFGLFDRVGEWINRSHIDNSLPREERIIKDSAVDAILKDPAFDIVKNEAKFKTLCKELETFIGGKKDDRIN